MRRRWKITTDGRTVAALTHRPSDKWIAKLVKQDAEQHGPGLYALRFDGRVRYEWEASHG